MDITKTKNGTELVVSVKGRLDTTTAPTFEDGINADIEGVTSLIIDFGGVEYVSSAGLRVLLSTQKVMNKQGSMKLINVCEDVMGVFEITGFSDILVIE